jgi:hypothetical protein
MIIQVNQFGDIQTDRVMAVQFVDFPQFANNGQDRDKACRLAFRAVNRRREKDYNEIVHNTRVMQIAFTVQGDLVSTLENMR